MKAIKRVGAALAAAALVFTLAPAAQAAQPSHTKHRQLAYSMVVAVFYQQDYDDQDAICYGWTNDIGTTEFVNDLVASMSGLGMSVADRKWGIREGFNDVCADY
jgi:hypothetical protein